MLINTESRSSTKVENVKLASVKKVVYPCLLLLTNPIPKVNVLVDTLLDIYIFLLS